MIYSNIEPGLLILEGLEPYDEATAFKVVESLISHKRSMEKKNITIPMTKEYIEKILIALDSNPIVSPPIRRDFKQYVIATLSKVSEPLLSQAGIESSRLEPEITSDWIKEETRKVWLDSITSSIFEYSSDEESVLAAITWPRQQPLPTTSLINAELCKILEITYQDWTVPVLTDAGDWAEIICRLSGWPKGLDTWLIDNYAKRQLGIPKDQLGNRKRVVFQATCHRDIQNETNESNRNAIIEVIAAKVYNKLQPSHHDEKIASKKGVRRIYVRKMKPPIRLQYSENESTITFSLYSMGDHDRGLTR